MFRTRHLLLKLCLVALVIIAMLLIALDAQITGTFNRKMWEVPARVYARPLELFVGKRLTADDLAYELQVLGYREVSSLRGPGEVARSVIMFD